MKIAIIGTGGVGGYFGAALVRAGFDVTFLARGENLKAILSNGIKVESIFGDFAVTDLKATDSIAEIEKPDLVIVCVKAWQIKEIRDELKATIHSSSLILPLQNGVLAAEELAEKISQENILGGLCRIISKIESPGTIKHFGVTPSIVFGALYGQSMERLNRVQEVFSAAGIASTISNDINADIWKKFIAICVSGLLAVSRTTYGEMRNLNETRRLMIDLIREIYELSKAMDVNIESDFIDKTVSFIDTFPPDSTSSLTRDVWDGKPSEIEYQNGAVVRLGEQYGVETPINRFVYNCILPSENKARGVGQK